MNHLRSAIFLTLLSILLMREAAACTTFVLQDQGRLLFGRNLDWNWEEGLVMVNPRGIAKTALTPPAAGRSPALWVARHGSVTFNQFGREQPFGGMNEAGLVIEQMMLPESRYPDADARPEVDMLQWIQYQLDLHATVAEVVVSDSVIRIAQPEVPPRIHYLVSDATGDVAAIEFIDGRMVVHRGAELPLRALANSPYAASFTYAQSAVAPGGSSSDPGSLDRFACAARRASAFRADTLEKDIAYAFDTLEQVRAGKQTVWQLVYDLAARKIHFRTLSHPVQRTIDLKAIDFASLQVTQAASLALVAKAPAVELSELTESDLRNYLETFYAREDLRQAMGDLTPTIPPMLAMLRTYTQVK